VRRFPPLINADEVFGTHSAPQCKVQLMPKKQYLGFKPGAGLDQIRDDRPKGIKNRKHRVS